MKRRDSIIQEVVYSPIGVIRSPYPSPEGAPIQVSPAPDRACTVEVFEEYAGGLADLNGFSHIFLLYHFHQSEGFHLKVVPFLDSEKRGVFATRAPRRPNGIGQSVVRLEKIEGNILYIQGCDILDGTPLLDIKPYVPFFDETEDEVRIGWLTGKRETARGMRSDQRFM